jgi:hypothetical protein
MTLSGRSLGRHISPSLDDARLDRQCAAIATLTSSTRPRPPHPRFVAAAVATPVICLAIVAFVIVIVRSHSVVEAPAGGETITLPDGSRAVLDPRSKLTLIAAGADLVRVGLDRGGVDLDVVHADGKQFVVIAKGYEVRVLGTRFSVRLLDAGHSAVLEVKVARGRVRVAREGDTVNVRVLDAGETWSTVLDGPALPPTSFPTPFEVTRTDAPPPATPRVRSATALPDGPKELLSRAEAARASNHPRESAQLLNALRVRYRADPRAGLAAFELGRLRLDRLLDPAGAADALNDAIAIAPDAPFREDAQARLVEAYEAARNRPRCLDARLAYLTRYPHGVHREKVALRCTW